MYVLGGGSNVVFSDAGFPGLVLRVAIGGIEFRDARVPEVRAGAGVDWDTLVRDTVERGWTGIECLSGIPGTVGGTPIQNVGAYGQEIAETLVSVTCLDRTTLERLTFGAAVATAHLSNTLEDRQGPLPLEGGACEVELRGFQLMTIRIE